MEFYHSKTSLINNWNLADLSSHKIISNFHHDKKRNLLYNLIESKNLWKQRIAVVSIYYFIKRNKYKDILTFSELQLDPKHDLIHKATSWMLRETKIKMSIPKRFLDKHHRSTPGTML